MTDPYNGPERRAHTGPTWPTIVAVVLAASGLTSWGTAKITADHYNKQAIAAFNGTCKLTKQARPITNRRSFDLAEFIDTRADSELRNLELLRRTLGRSVSPTEFEALADVEGRRQDIAAARRTAKLFRITFPVTKTFCADVLAGKAPPPPRTRTRDR